MEFMNKGILSILIILISLPVLDAQQNRVLITGSFYQMPLISFIDKIEHEHHVEFFYDESSIANILVTANFSEVTLKKCLETILEGKQVNFYISENNIVVIYSGNLLSDLFPGSDNRLETNAKKSTEKKLSREKLQQLQYQIINIGIPGKNTAKTATIIRVSEEFRNRGACCRRKCFCY